MISVFCFHFLFTVDIARFQRDFLYYYLHQYACTLYIFNTLSFVINFRRRVYCRITGMLPPSISRSGGDRLLKAHTYLKHIHMQLKATLKSMLMTKTGTSLILRPAYLNTLFTNMQVIKRHS